MKGFCCVYVCKTGRNTFRFFMNNGRRNIREWLYTKSALLEGDRIGKRVCERALKDNCIDTNIFPHVGFESYVIGEFGADYRFSNLKSFGFYSIVIAYNSDICSVEKVDSVQDFMKAVFEHSGSVKKAKADFNLYFRGQNAFWDLKPSLFRNVNFVRNESRMNAKIVADRPGDFSDCGSTFERLVKLKHFNQPSRLLDLTSNSLVALFFAIESVRSCEYGGIGAVLTAYSDAHNEKYSVTSDSVTMLCALSNADIGKHFKSEEDMLSELRHQCEKESGGAFELKNRLKEFDRCFLVKPPLNNPRIVQQQGCFIMCGSAGDGLNEMPGALFDFFRSPVDGKGKVYLLNPKNITRFEGELSLLGITPYYVYPDLERDIEVSKKEYEHS